MQLTPQSYVYFNVHTAIGSDVPSPHEPEGQAAIMTDWINTLPRERPSFADC